MTELMTLMPETNEFSYVCQKTGVHQYTHSTVSQGVKDHPLMLPLVQS